jgi:hypothetical protein
VVRFQQHTRYGVKLVSTQPHILINNQCFPAHISTFTSIMGYC